MKLRVIQLFIFTIVFNALIYPQASSRQSNNDAYLFQQLRLEKIGADKDLKQKNLNAILQDRHGILWLGSAGAGLIRYDGYQFTTFTRIAFDSTSLSSNNVSSLYEDSQGKLWVGTDNGLNCFVPETASFQHFRLDSPTRILAEQKIVSDITEDAAGNFWLATYSGIYRMQRRDSPENSYQIDYFPITPENLSSPRNYINSLHIDPDNHFWIGTNDGLFLLTNQGDDEFNPLSPATPQFNILPQNQYLPDSIKTPDTYQITDIQTLSNGQVWGVGNYGIFGVERRENPWQFEFYPLFILNNSTGNRFWERSGPMGPELWIPGIWEDKLFIFDLNKRIFLQTLQAEDLLLPTGDVKFVDAALHSLYEDRTGLVWITSANGLYRYDPAAARFYTYPDAFRKLLKASPFNLRTAYLDSRQNLWLINENIYTGSPEKGNLDRLQTSKAYGQKDWIFYNKILEDSRGNFWFGLEGNGIYHYDHQSGQILRHYLRAESENPIFRYNNVTALLEAGSGHIWAGISTLLRTNPVRQLPPEPANYLYRIDPATGETAEFKIADWPQASEENYIFALAEGNADLLWVGTQFGLLRFTINNAAVEIFQHDPGQQSSLSNNRVHAVLPDPLQPERYIWAATFGGGLNRLDQQTAEFEHFTTEDGLPSNDISSLLADDNGNLWLGTSNGLSKITLDQQNRDILHIRIYTPEDGLTGEDFTYFYGNNAHKARSGEFVFSSLKSFDVFSPTDFTTEIDTPHTLLNGLQVHYQPLIPGAENSPIDRPVAELQEITLPYHQNTLTFDMLALHYRVPEKNRYRYRLIGYDNEWVENNYNRQAHYTGLPPGNYTFNFQAAATNNIWTRNGSSLKITITPPWWRTWWAYIAYFLLIVGALFLFQRYEINRQRLKHNLEMESLRSEQERRETERLKEMDRLKTRFFTNISHEFRTPLTLIMGPVDQMLSQKPSESTQQQLDIIQRNARRLYHLINQLLDLSRLENSRLPLQAAPGDIVDYLKGLTMGFSSWSERKQVTLRLIVNEGVAEIHQSDKPLYFDRDFLEKILNNLISNAMKFTSKGGKVTVELGIGSAELGMRNAELFLIRVSDTGIGIPAERLPHVFDRFYQADSSATREYEGTGIGLALCKDLVERHYGTIEVESIEGKGSTFTVRLPLGKAHLPPEDVVAAIHTAKRVKPISQDVFEPNYEDATVNPLAEISAADDKGQDKTPELPEDQQSTTILLVEDHSDFRAYMRSCLLDNGDDQFQKNYQILEAKNGEVGWQQSLASLPDIIISDIMMPKMNGYELCKKLKSDQRTSHIPVILLTAKATQDDKLLGLETGADDYLSKPFDSRELNLRVRNLVKQRRKLQALFSQSVTLKPSEVTVNSLDETFLKKAIEIVETHISDENFDIDTLQDALNLSRSHLHRKLKALTGKSATDFIRTVRLHRAADLLRQQAGTVTEIAYQTGFNSQAYFSRSFQKEFGMSPKAFMKGTR